MDVLPEHIIISVPNFNDKVKSELDEWRYILKHSEIRQGCKLECADMMQDRLSLLKMSLEERNAYWSYLKEVRTAHRAIELTAEENLKKGIKIGKAKGIAEEAARSEAKVKQAEAKAEQAEAKLVAKQLDMAKAMIKDKVDVNTIAKYTGLEAKTIKDLSKKNTVS